MRRSPLLSLSLALGVAASVDLVYITDLAIYSSLAPCAQSALYYNVQYLTEDVCPSGVTDLEACVCTKNQNLASISGQVVSSVSYSCGSTATADQSSAATVLGAYCNQENLPTLTFPTPANPVSTYITDLPEYAALPPCIQYALSEGVQSLTYAECPTDAPSLATCACFKNQNSDAARQTVSSSARYSCSSKSVDVSSAMAFFDAYCALNNGTSDFPTPTAPPGDMTYYITDLPQYTSLAPCAASAVSYAVLGQTNDLCPSGPQALAACACLKDDMTSDILSSIRSNVKYSCDTTATDDISSALGVYNFYCSAAEAQVVASGVTASVSQSYPHGTARSGTKSGPQATGGTGGTGSSGSTSGGTDGKKTSSGPGIGMIVGIVVGVIVVLALLGALIFFLVKNAKKRKAMELHSGGNSPMTRPSTAANPGISELYSGKQELPADTALLPPPSPSPSTLKVNGLPPRADTVSPVSAFSPPSKYSELNGQGAPVPPMPNSAELYGQPAQYPPKSNTAELQGQGQPGTYPPSPNTAELYGQGAAFRPELPGQGAAYPPPNRPELQGQGFAQQQPGQYNRQELAGGQYGYPLQELPPQQSPPPPQGGYPGFRPQGGQPSPYGQPPPPQSPYGQQPSATGMSWQAGPVPMVHEMDGGYGGGSPGQAR